MFIQVAKFFQTNLTLFRTATATYKIHNTVRLKTSTEKVTKSRFVFVSSAVITRHDNRHNSTALVLAIFVHINLTNPFVVMSLH